MVSKPQLWWWGFPCFPWEMKGRKNIADSSGSGPFSQLEELPLVGVGMRLGVRLPPKGASSPYCADLLPRLGPCPGGTHSLQRRVSERGTYPVYTHRGTCEHVGTGAVRWGHTAAGGWSFRGISFYFFKSEDWYFLSTQCLPGSVPTVLHVLTHLILWIIL